MSQELPQPVELRAHHLFPLVRTADFRQLPDVLAPVIKAALSLKYFLLGYTSNNRFHPGMMEIINGILDGEIQEVRIVDGYDGICENCPKKSHPNGCYVNGYTWSGEFLQAVDRAIVANSGGEILVGETYTSAELVAKIADIRKALRKTALQLPRMIINEVF